MRTRRLAATVALVTWLTPLCAAPSVWADDTDGDGVDNAIDHCSNTPPGTTVDAEGRPLGDIDLDCDTDLLDYSLFQDGFTGSITSSPMNSVPVVPIGNPGNPNDMHGAGYGGVDYEYNIGTFEVTAEQYTEFLNAVAASDTYGLYNSSMWSNASGCKIERSGVPGSYTYSVEPDWADRPVNLVSWGDAARFCSWMHNGQPTGAQEWATTEGGSYYLAGASTNAALMAVERESDATWVIPSVDEWYKAAYHQNDGPTDHYFTYPTGSSSEPSNNLIDPDPGNSANFNDYAPLFPMTIGSPYYRTEIGAFENSDSPYGTFDQGGNVWEWTESGFSTTRGVRGGSYFDYHDPIQLDTLHRNFSFSSGRPEEKFPRVGFRVAEMP